MTGCTCPERHLDPLGARSELSFPSAGVLVLPDDYETLAAGRGGALHRFHHGILHFAQILGSPFLQNHGLRLVRAAYAVVAGRGRGEFVREASRLSRPHPSGVSCEDLLESAAEVEANRLGLSASLPVNGFVHRLRLEKLHPDADAPQRRGFEHVAERLGDNAAVELLAPLTFLAFVHDDPCEAFAHLLGAAARSPERFAPASAAELLDALGWGDGFARSWDRVEAGEAVGTEQVARPLRAAMRVHGRAALLETLARPAAHLGGVDERMLRAVEPPVIVLPLRDGGLVHHRNGVALDDEGFARSALADAAVLGAAERMTFDGGEPAYCIHAGCAHHATALCARWFAPPSAADGHDACGFPAVLARAAAS